MQKHVFRNGCYSLVLLISLFFNSHAQFQPLGNALNTAPGTYRLTQDSFFQVGAIWNKLSHDLRQPLHIEGKLNFGTRDANGADGICFIIQDQCAGELNLYVGGGIGYNHMEGKSIAVEFDTYQNNNTSGVENNSDPDYDHLAVLQMGNTDHANILNTIFPAPVPISANPAALNVEDGNWHDVKILYHPTTKNLQVYFDQSLRINMTYDILQNTFNGNPNVFWGFSASTGGSTNLQQVSINPSSLVLKDTTVCLSKTSSLSVSLPSLDVFKGKSLALNCPVKTSSIESELYTGSNAVDQDTAKYESYFMGGGTLTRWASKLGSDNEWICLDLGTEFNIDSVVIYWQGAYADTYKIQFSTDSITWFDQVSTAGGPSVFNGHAGIDIRPTTGTNAQNKRYVRILCLTRGTKYGYSIYTIRVLGQYRYKWSPDNGTINNIYSSNPTFTPVISNPAVQSFTYTVTIPDPCLLQKTLSFTITNHCPLTTALQTGTDDADLISIYPNPTTGILTVTTSSAEETEYTVYNTLGQTVFYIKGNTSEQHIDLSSITTGAYILQVSTAQHRVLKKIIKNE